MSNDVADWAAQLAKMNSGELHAAAVGQFAGLHLLTRLHEQGATPEACAAMMADLAGSLEELMREQKKRGGRVTFFPPAYTDWLLRQDAH